MNGFKVETVARASGLPEDMYMCGTDDPEGPSPPMTFVGTDDENYGGKNGVILVFGHPSKYLKICL